MKIALMLSGQFRSFEQNWPFFRKHVIRDYDVDVFAHLPNEPDSFKIFEYGFNRVAIEAVPTFDETPYLQCTTMPRKTWYDDGFIIQAHLRRLWHLYQVSLLRQSHEQAFGVQYDLVVRCRLDLDFTTPLEPFEEFDPTAIYIPCHDNWDGYNDRLAIGSPDLIDAYCRNLFTVPQCVAAQGKLHSEPNLKWHLDEIVKAPIRRTKVLFNTVRHGEVWRPVFHPHLGDIPL